MTQASKSEAENERALILQWLNKQKESGQGFCERSTGRKQRDYAAGVIVVSKMIEGITRGDHLPSLAAREQEKDA